MIFIDLRDKVDSNALSKYYSILTDKMDDEKRNKLKNGVKIILEKIMESRILLRKLSRLTIVNYKN